MMKYLRQFAVGLAAWASSSAAFAQTCPACYNNAASQAPGLLQALRTGVLVMMLPCLAMFIVIYAVLYRRRNSFREGSDEGAAVENGRSPEIAPRATPLTGKA